MKAADENDRLRAGTLPYDPEIDAVAMDEPSSEVSDSDSGDTGEGHAPEPRTRVADDDSWRSQIITKTTKDGAIVVLPIPANVTTIVRCHPEWRGVVAYDAFAETIVTLSPPPWHLLDAPEERRTGEWSEADAVRAINWLARQEQLDVGAHVVEQAIPVVAEGHVVHPVRDYLRGLAWDGKPRLECMLAAYFGACDNEYTRGVGSRWMIGAVARVKQPGCQVDCTLLLEGPQGWRKTSAFRTLVPRADWYSDTGITIGEKDSYQNLRCVWIYGLDELVAIRGRELTRVKNFLTATRDRYRPSYGRRARDFARQCVFCGTTNEDVYLVDKTGNRRFWPVRLRQPADADAIARNRDQLWAEAVVRYERGENWHVDTVAFRALCEAQQAERVCEDPWESIVADWLAAPYERSVDERGRVTHAPYDASCGVRTVDALVHALGKRAGDIAKGDEMRVADVLRALAYERGAQHWEGGRRVRRFVKAVTPVTNGGDAARSQKSPRRTMVVTTVNACKRVRATHD